MEAKRFLIIPCLLFSIQCVSAELQDKCPQLPPAIKSIEPSYSDWEAHEEFEKKYAEEFKKVDDAWKKLENGYSASKKKYYSLSVTKIKHLEIFNEIKSLCWAESMGIDESEKDNLCHRLERPPTDNDWSKILLCVIGNAEKLRIKIDAF